MTDSKTAKKIEVCPCPWKRHEQGYRVMRDRETLWPEPPLIGANCCGTEAEAQQKAAELEQDLRDAEKSVAETLAPFRSEVAAASAAAPVEPPLIWSYPQSVTLKDKKDLLLHGHAGEPIWCMEHSDGLIGIRLDDGDSGTVYLTKEQAQELSEQLAKLAATELVEPAPRPPESEVILNFISQNRHLPDCADECHGKCAQRIAQSFFDDGLAMKHDWEKLLDEVLEVHNAAASSPVARPQHPPVLIDRIINRIAELPDRTSPEDWPEAMLVTAGELRIILSEELIDETK